LRRRPETKCVFVSSFPQSSFAHRRQLLTDV
jgi:hypothetical protein